MRTFKKSVAVLLVALMLLTAAPLSGFAGLDISFPELKADAASVSGGYLTSGYCGDTAEGDPQNIYWELSDDGVLTVTGTGKIAPEAFNYDLRIKKVIISDGITNIPKLCFNRCYNLSGVTMGDDVVTIADNAFFCCEALVDLDFSDSLKTIESGAFAACTALTTINLPDSLEEIGSQAFWNCESLTTVKLPDSVTTVEDGAFGLCEKLTSFTLGAGVTDISSNTFGLSDLLSVINVSEANPKYASYDGILYNKEKTELVIVPPSVSGEITIPATVEILTTGAVSACKNLTGINVENGNKKFRSVDGIVYSANGKNVIFCPRGRSGAVELADGAEYIESGAFANCDNITEIRFSNSVTTVATRAFGDCDGLEKIDFSDSLVRIGDQAFDSCDSLRSITLPDSLTTIENFAFGQCSRLETVAIGAGTTSIDYNTFDYCRSLKSITVSANNNAYSSDSGILYNKDKTELICIPNAIKGEVTIPATVKSFAYKSINGRQEITAFNVEEGNRYIKSVDGIIYSADGKELICCPGGRTGSVTVSAGTEVIGDYAFYDCNKITEVVLPDSLTTVGEYAFYLCSSVTKINLPDSIKTIGGWGFFALGEIDNFSIPSAITKIDQQQFDYCHFKTLTLPQSLQTFDHASWTNLKALTILNRYCRYIGLDAPGLPSDCTIRAYCGSPGHELAIKRLLNFESIGHTFLDWYVAQPATFESNGIERRDCAYCGGYDEIIIPKLEKDVFTATFMANGEVVSTVDFPRGATEITEPKVPAKDRYIGQWEEYTLTDTDITINAVYTLIRSEDASEIETDSEVIHYTDNDDILFRFNARADALVVKSTVSKSVPLDIVLVVDQSGSMEDTLGGKTKKVDALKETAKDFVNTVFENSEITGADHRISLVGFGLSGNYQGFRKNENTELLTSARGIVNFDDIRTTDYASSLLSVNVDGAVNSALTAAIDSIEARGATAADLGFEMAKGVFANTDSEGRQRVVVFMTDGEPTYQSGFQTSVANSAIYNASLLKNAYEASVYSVGVFSASDSNNKNINKFMNAVSSGYPDAVSMKSLGEGNDGQYYLTVNNTDSLTTVFKTISTESLSHTAPFDNLTFIKTLSGYVTLTTKQEEQLRIDLCRQYGITNDDIIITRNNDGTTTVQIDGLTPYEVTKDGGVIYEVAVEFFASLNEKAAAAGGYIVDTEDSGVMLGENAKGYEVTFDTSEINLDTDKTRVVFTINDEVYEINEFSPYGSIVVPQIEVSEDWSFSGWNVDNQSAVNGLVLNATLTKADRTIIWHTADGDIVQKYSEGDMVTAPEVKMTAAGDAFLSWDKSIPTTMPDENLEFTAVYGKHVHKYSSSVTRKMTCTSDGVRTFTCSCGSTYDEAITAIGHNYEALTPSLEKGDAKCTFCCTNCGDKYDYALEYDVVDSADAQNTILYDFRLTDDEVSSDIQPDGEIVIRIPLSEIHGDINKANVYRHNDDGSKTQVPSVVENGFLVITCEHFTPYEVIFVAPCENHEAGEWVVTKEATCTNEGSRYLKCVVCESLMKTETIPVTAHNYASDVVLPSCTEGGYTVNTCTECRFREVVDYTPASGHADNDHNGNCDSCGCSTTGNCSHICHKTGFLNFIWKIVQLFWKLFNMNPICDCGAAHY